MTNEKMLSVIEAVLSQRNGWVDDATKAREQLLEDLRHDCQKKKGNVKRDNLLKKLMKSIPEHRCWKNHYSPTNGQFGFLDGYRAYILNDDYGFEAADCEPFNFKDVKPKDANIKVHVDLDDVQFFIKKSKAETGKGWTAKNHPYKLETDEIEIYFNPIYLVEFCQMFDTDYIMCSKPMSPAMYESENGEWGVVLPIRKSCEY